MKIMLRIKYLYLLVFILSVCCCSGDHQKASVETGRIDSLLTIYRDTIFRSPRKAIELLTTEKEATSDSISYYKINAYIGYCYYQDNKPDSMQLYCKQVIDFCHRQKAGNPRVDELAAYAYNYQGVYFQESNQRDSAILSLQKAIDAIHRTDHRNKLPDIYINMADNYNQNGNFPVAISYYRKALMTADSLGMKDKLDYVIYNGMARIYSNLKNYSLADYYYTLAEKTLKSKTVYEQFLFSNNRGNYYYNINDYQKALQWFYKSASITKTMNHPLFQAIVDSNLGETYLSLNQADSAQFYLDKASGFFLTPNANASHIFYFNGLYASLALLKNDLATAERLLSKPYDTSVINPTYIFLNNKRLEELYEKKGDFRKAYEYRKSMDTYNDSLHNITIQNNIAEIDFRYKQDTTLLKRDILIAEGKAEVFQFRTISILLTSLLLLILMGTGIIIVYQKRKRDQHYSRQMATITKLRMENVRNRISPHYIFNVLNAITPALRQYDELSYPLKLLIDSIRNNLLVSEKIAITLDEEIRIVKNYLELKKSINQDFPTVEWNIGPDVDVQTQIPSMIMQIPIENSIKYAFEAEKEAEQEDLLSIKIVVENKSLHITITDNGIGFTRNRFSGNENGTGTGTGLKVLSRTIELLNIKNQQKISFSIQNLKNTSSELHGTQVIIIVPLNYNYFL